MRLRKKKKIESTTKIVLGAICAIMSFSCFVMRIPELATKYSDEIGLFSAKFVLPNGSIKHQSARNTTPPANTIANLNTSSQVLRQNTVSVENEISSQAISQIPEPAKESVVQHSSDEKTYPIIESQFGASGLNYENFYVKKTIEYPLNIADELSKRPDINITKDGSPQVLIVHTHTSESYMDQDQGFYYESFYPRSTEYESNVTRVGNAIAEQLRQAGIGVIHDLTYHDNPSYNGSYYRAAQTIRKNLEDNPSIQVVLDIHRDSIGNNESGKVKPTFVYNGKKAAQIMIMSGCDTDGSLEFPDWEYNLRFALRLQQKAETLYPGITRPMYFGDVKYNMDITHGSVLIEVGTDANTLDEAVYTGSLLGNALSQVLEELKN